MKSPATFRRREVGFLLLLILAAGMFFYLQRIARREKAASGGSAEFHPTMGDLFAPWRGSQELIFFHRDPYGPEVTRDIQSAYYGMVLTGASGEPKDQQRFAYPVYIAFYLAPALPMPFSTLRVVFWWFLLAITAASVPMWLRFTNGPAKLFPTIVITAMTISSVPVVQGLNLQQLALLTACLLAAAAALLARKRYFAAGAVLALASIKPQLSALVTVWLALWALSSFRKRRSFLWGLLAMQAALVAGGEALLPGWIPEFLKGLVAYNKYTGGKYWLVTLLPSPLGPIVAVLIGIGTAVLCWRARREPEDSFIFVLTFCLLLNVTILIVPATKAAFNQILLLPALLLLLDRWQSIWTRNLPSKVACVLLGGIAFLPWLAASGVILVWWLRPAGAAAAWRMPLYVSPLLRVVTLAALMLLGWNAFRGLRSQPADRNPLPQG